MENKMTLYKQSIPNKYSKLQVYDFNEFSGEVYQALKANFNSKNYEYLRFKNGKYEQCIFEKCSFNAVGFSGTHFSSCELRDFVINSSNMQFCDFSSCILEGDQKISIICNSNMSQSMFLNVTLKNLNIKSTTISQAQFINTLFQDVIWESCTLQDNSFQNVIIMDSSLVGCNLEYSDFKNIELKNVKLPLHQIPYTFGLLECLKSFPEQILIDACSSDCAPLTAEEYISLLPDLFSYYKEMHEYFPAINIALFYEDYKQADSLIDAGIQYYIRTNDFRKIKGVCKLISSHPFYDKHYMTQLYFKLVEYYNLISVTEYEKYQYSLHINDIKKILTEFDNMIPAVQLYLKTDITASDTEKLGVFYQLIEQCLKDYNISTEDYSVEIRHNSDPLSFWLNLAQFDPNVVVNAVGILMSVITANPLFLQNAIAVVAGIATIGSFALQISQAFKSDTNAPALDCPNVTANDIKYIKDKNQVLKDKNISIEVSLPFFNFSYQNKEIDRN